MATITECIVVDSRYLGCKYVVYQNNVVVQTTGGFAMYTNRKGDEPGTITISTNISKNSPVVITMFSQIEPGRSRMDNDTKEMRIKWFAQCLDEIAKQVPDMENGIAFSRAIGCGMAGDVWIIYRQLIDDFATRNPSARVY